MVATTDRDVQQLQQALQRVGGLVNVTALSDAWEVSGSRVRILVHREGFPSPVTHIAGRPVWARAQVDEWRRRQFEGRGH